MNDIHIPVIPRQITLFACPACGRLLKGGSYSIDEERSKCLKSIHVTTLVPARYQLMIDEKKG